MTKPRALAAGVLAAAALAAAAAADGPFAPIGLPSSRSHSPVFNRFASLPPFTAELPGRGEWFLLPTASIKQAMIASLYIQEDGGGIPLTNLDFETVGLELSAAWGLSDRISLEFNAEVHYLWGGLFDGLIAGFHEAFGFPNAGRELFDAGDVSIYVKTRNGYTLYADEAMLLVSDPAFGAAFRLIARRDFSLTARAAGTVPLSLGKGFSGSELPQALAGFYLDWRPARRSSLHASAGGILPFESFGLTGTNPRPLLQSRISGFFDIGNGFLFFADFNLKTSPIDGEIYEGNVNFFGLPSADLLIGVAFAGPRERREGRYFGFAIQEDPISHNSTDVGFIWAGAFRSR